MSESEHVLCVHGVPLFKECGACEQAFQPERLSRPAHRQRTLAPRPVSSVCQVRGREVLEGDGAGKEIGGMTTNKPHTLDDGKGEDAT